MFPTRLNTPLSQNRHQGNTKEEGSLINGSSPQNGFQSNYPFSHVLIDTAIPFHHVNLPICGINTFPVAGKVLPVGAKILPHDNSNLYHISNSKLPLTRDIKYAEELNNAENIRNGQIFPSNNANVAPLTRNTFLNISGNFFTRGNSIMSHQPPRPFIASNIFVPNSSVIDAKAFIKTERSTNASQTTNANSLIANNNFTNNNAHVSSVKPNVPIVNRGTANVISQSMITSQLRNASLTFSNTHHLSKIDTTVSAPATNSSSAKNSVMGRRNLVSKHNSKLSMDEEATKFIEECLTGKKNVSRISKQGVIGKHLRDIGNDNCGKHLREIGNDNCSVGETKNTLAESTDSPNVQKKFHPRFQNKKYAEIQNIISKSPEDIKKSEESKLFQTLFSETHYTKNENDDQILSTVEGTQLLNNFENRITKKKPTEQCAVIHCDSEESSPDKDDDSNDIRNFGSDKCMKELYKKQKHPNRLHPDLWHNEPNVLNDGPICACSKTALSTGIRHNVYAGEGVIQPCSPGSNNADRLFHYRIIVFPPTNFMMNRPTIIKYNGFDYVFEGFSLLSHVQLGQLPPCKVIRFNICYTILYIREKMPDNFTIGEVDAFHDYLFNDILELFDFNLKPKREEGQDCCPAFHFLPRFTRELPDNIREILPMWKVLEHFNRMLRPLFNANDLDSIHEQELGSWQMRVKRYKGMIVTKPNMKPTSLRVDDIERTTTEDNVKALPQIIHFGTRPIQLLYAGCERYQKVWQQYVKHRHLLINMAKPTAEDKRQFAAKEAELLGIKNRTRANRGVTISISSEGFYTTGIRVDVTQHALLLPVLACHLRFHQSLCSLERSIGYSFKDRYLLQMALTHPSYREYYGTNSDHVRNALTNCGLRHPEFGDKSVHYVGTRKRGINTLMKIMAQFAKQSEVKSNIGHYERLEFLGDAVVEFVTSVHLYHILSDTEEGGLATYRAAIVQNKHLAELAQTLKLDQYFLHSHTRGSSLCHGPEIRHAMANCFEALIGALYLDGGLEVADKVFGETYFKFDCRLLSAWMNYPKHPLQEQFPDGDREWIPKFPMLQKAAEFEKVIGIKFKHIRLLARAFTDRSVGFTKLCLGSNQRMEFLGDTVLQLISSTYLYKHFPYHHEGHLSLLRSSLVNNRTQAVICDNLGLSQYATYANSKDASKIKDRADLLESFLGALFIDKGLQYAQEFCEVCFFPRLQQFIVYQDWNDPKSKLQQCCLTLRNLSSNTAPDIPIYRIKETKGPTNSRVYTVVVYFRGKRLAAAKGHNVQQAEMNAAKEALKLRADLFPHLAWQKRALGLNLKRQLEEENDIVCDRKLIERESNRLLSFSKADSGKFPYSLNKENSNYNNRSNNTSRRNSRSKSISPTRNGSRLPNRDRNEVKRSNISPGCDSRYNNRTCETSNSSRVKIESSRTRFGRREMNDFCKREVIPQQGRRDRPRSSDRDNNKSTRRSRTPIRIRDRSRSVDRDNNKSTRRSRTPIRIRDRSRSVDRDNNKSTRRIKSPVIRRRDRSRSANQDNNRSFRRSKSPLNRIGERSRGTDRDNNRSLRSKSPPIRIRQRSRSADRGNNRSFRRSKSPLIRRRDRSRSTDRDNNWSLRRSKSPPIRIRLRSRSTDLDNSRSLKRSPPIRRRERSRSADTRAIRRSKSPLIRIRDRSRSPDQDKIRNSRRSKSPLNRGRKRSRSADQDSNRISKRNTSFHSEIKKEDGIYGSLKRVAIRGLGCNSKEPNYSLPRKDISARRHSESPPDRTRDRSPSADQYENKCSRIVIYRSSEEPSDCLSIRNDSSLQRRSNSRSLNSNNDKIKSSRINLPRSISPRRNSRDDNRNSGFTDGVNSGNSYNSSTKRQHSPLRHRGGSKETHCDSTSLKKMKISSLEKIDGALDSHPIRSDSRGDSLECESSNESLQKLSQTVGPFRRLPTSSSNSWQNELENGISTENRKVLSKSQFKIQINLSYLMKKSDDSRSGDVENSLKRTVKYEPYGKSESPALPSTQKIPAKKESKSSFSVDIRQKLKLIRQDEESETQFSERHVEYPTNLESGDKFRKKKKCDKSPEISFIKRKKGTGKTSSKSLRKKEKNKIASEGLPEKVAKKQKKIKCDRKTSKKSRKKIIKNEPESRSASPTVEELLERHKILYENIKLLQKETEMSKLSKTVKNEPSECDVLFATVKTEPDVTFDKSDKHFDGEIVPPASPQSDDSSRDYFIDCIHFDKLSKSPERFIVLQSKEEPEF